MEAKVCESEMEAEPMDSNIPAGIDDLKIDELTGKSLNFDDWVSLISRIEKIDRDNLEKICLVYDSFLSKFPLCLEYWRRYVGHKIRLCAVDEVVEVFERAVQSATYSVGVWVDYCTFSMAVFEDPSDIRRLFKRGISYVGKDYLCHALWDQYIKFELTQQQWSFLAGIYVEALRFPTKKLHRYYENFKKLVALCNKDMGCQTKCRVDLQLESPVGDKVPKIYSDGEISSVVKELFDPCTSFATSKTLLQKYISIGEHLHQEASQRDKNISSFEANISRNYFHVKSLDIEQLENWHHYLDFVEMQGDFDWVVKLYERCLIPCANYPEFWMRYVEFMETKGGREIANYALNRATQVFLKRVSVVHLFSARFKENQGDVVGAHSALLQYNAEPDLKFVENVVIKANVERRLGNFVTANNIFEEAIITAAETKNLHYLPSLYIHFSRLKHVITDSSDAARDVLIDGIKHLPNSMLLLEELINFATTNGGKRHIHVLDSVVHNVISPSSDVSCGLNKKDAEDVSSLYLKFVDLCGTIHDVRKAWNRHIRLFPHCIRTSFTEHPITNIESLDLDNSGRETTIATKPEQPSGDLSPDNPVHLPSQDEELPTVDSIPSHNSTNLIPEQIIPAQENLDIQFEQIVPNEDFEIGEPDIGAQEIVEVSEKPIEDSAGISEPSVDLDCSKVLGQPIEDTAECQVAEGVTISEREDIKENSNGNDIQQDFDFDHDETEQDMKSLSLDDISLHPHDNPSLDPNPPIPSQIEAPQKTCDVETNKHDNDEDSLIHSQIKDIVSDSPRTEMEVVTSSSSTSHESPIPTEQPPNPQMPINSGRGNWQQMNSSGKVRRESNFGPRGHIQRKSHHQQQQQQQHQASHQNPQPEFGGPMSINQGFPSQPVSQHPQAQHQYQATQPPPNTWPLQNYPSMQSLGEQGIQNNQGYGQAWQYYYYQQQLFMQQQNLRQSQQFQQQSAPFQQQYFQQPTYQQLQSQQHRYNQQQPQLYQHPQQHQNQHQNSRFEIQNPSLELNGTNQLGLEPGPLVMASQDQVTTSHNSGASLTSQQPSPGRQ